MKKLLRTSFCLLAVAFLSSCSDDDGGNVEASIEAKWTPTKTVTKIGSSNPISQNYSGNEPGCDKDYIQFQSGGTLKTAVFFKNASNACTEDAVNSNWEKTNDALTISGGTYQGDYTIKKLNGSDLTLEGESTIGGTTTVTTVYFKKVN